MPRETLAQWGQESLAKPDLALQNVLIFVGQDGIGPSTSFLSGKRSTNELLTHCHFRIIQYFLQKCN